jgi:hypothetical protein
LRLPEDAATHGPVGTELATIDGVTYVSLPPGAVLPGNQPSEIAAGVQVATLTEVLKDAINAASPHVALINTRVIEKIREQYSLDDEIKLLRTGKTQDTVAWNAWADECRAWGRQEKAKLGLGSIPPEPAPEAITMRQARLALQTAGLLTQVNAAIAAMTGAVGEAARIEWEFSSTVERHKPLVIALAPVLGMTDAQLDDLFIAAAAL